MKINFLSPHLRVSGGNRIAFTYAHELQKRGHEVTVYVRSDNAVRRSVANFFHLGYPTWIRNFSARVLRVAALSSEYVGDADVTIATTCQSMLLLKDFPASKGRQYYLVQHDEGLYHAPRSVADAAYKTSAKKIVVSTWLKEVMQSYGQDSLLLLNPIDTEQFKQTPRTVDTDTVRVLLLHHTYDWKGTAEGVAMLEKLKTAFPSMRIILFGVRDKKAISYPYDEYHHEVPQAELAELYSNSDIYLCPSWDEGFGLPSVEAMMCGAALVTYDNGGSRDYAFHEKTALVAKRRDVDDLSKQMERMVSDSVLRKRIASQGQAFVRTLPSWNEQTERLERALSENEL